MKFFFSEKETIEFGFIKINSDIKKRNIFDIIFRIFLKNYIFSDFLFQNIGTLIENIKKTHFSRSAQSSQIK